MRGTAGEKIDTGTAWGRRKVKDNMK